LLFRSHALHVILPCGETEERFFLKNVPAARNRSLPEAFLDTEAATAGGLKAIAGRAEMDDGKDDDDMNAVLNKNADDAGRRKGKSAANKSLITRNLRLAYGEVTSEGVPDRFLDILNRIDESEGKKS
jgi:hypothetical protein